MTNTIFKISCRTGFGGKSTFVFVFFFVLISPLYLSFVSLCFLPVCFVLLAGHHHFFSSLFLSFYLVLFCFYLTYFLSAQLCCGSLFLSRIQWSHTALSLLTIWTVTGAGVWIFLGYRLPLWAAFYYKHLPVSDRELGCPCWFCLLIA